jgi:hypothetical protein
MGIDGRPRNVIPIELATCDNSCKPQSILGTTVAHPQAAKSDGSTNPSGFAMNQREANMLCLRDTLEHLSSNQQRLEWMEDPEAIYLLTETMVRDLVRCQRLCESLRRRCSLERVA